MALKVEHTFKSLHLDNPVDAAQGDILPSHWNADLRVTGTILESQIPEHSASLLTDLAAVVTPIVNDLEIDAYSRAVMAGYTGTEGEFYTLLAQIDISALPTAP